MAGVYHIQDVSINGSARSGVRGVMLDRAWSDLAAGSSGTVQETLHAQIKSNPTAEFRTVQVGAWLTMLNGSSDAPCLTLSSCVMYGALAATDLVGYASGTVHEKRTATAGMVFMTGLSWSDGDVAELTARAVFRSTTGTTDPIVQALTVLPALPTPAEAWTVTGLTVGGVSVARVRRVNLSIDPKIQQRSEAGLPYPVLVFGGGPGGQIEFRLEFETEDISAVGTDLVTGNVVVTLTQYAQGGILSGTTKTITLANCLLRDASGPINGSQGSLATRTWVARPRYNGTTYPMVVA